MRTRILLSAALATFGLLAGGATQAAARRIFSYDPANEATRMAAGALTFEFDQKLLSTRVLRVRATEGEAAAELRPAGVGRGGLSALEGHDGAEHDLYEILPAEQGPEMIAALCPGDSRAWMAFGRLKANEDLRIRVIGADHAGRPRLCQTLDFTFHGEWRLPTHRPMDPDNLAEPHFPYK